MQIRLFYVAILAGLSTLLFHNNLMSRKKIRIVLLTLIILIYFLEVHKNDLYKRQLAVYHIKDAAIHSLAHLDPTDSTWYSIEYDSVRAKWNNACDKNNARIRKLIASTRPNPEQIIFYVIPFGALFVYRFWLYSEIRLLLRIIKEKIALLLPRIKLTKVIGFWK